MTGQQQSNGIERLLRQQAALATFGSYAFREPVLLNILNEAARVCAEGLDVPFCKVCRYREIENDLLIVAGYGWNPGVVGRVMSQADETSPQGRAYVTGLPVILRNLQEANNVLLPAFYAEHGIISIVDVIVKGTEGRPYGVLEIDSPIQHTYDEHDVNFLTGFANVLAEAVATATRNEALRSTVAKMKTLVLEKDKLLAERSMLAEELKHRVRNNLQLVQGMLASHEKNYSGADAKASVNGIIRRVVTLAEVYEQLLGTGMDRTVDLGGYVESLCQSLPGLQGEQNTAVRLICRAERLPVDLDTVTAIGMVVAETVSNSYEHALRDTGGTITVSLQRSRTAEEALLTIRDDGMGFVEQPGNKRHGVGLVRRLIEQVQGTAELRSEHGSTWAFRFPTKIPAAEPNEAEV
jgi:two-component sensor histidine kinase